MSKVKTAVSIPAGIFEQANNLARELDMSRSQLFTLAIEAYIQRHQNLCLLEALNAAYGEAPDEEETTLKRLIRDKHRQMVGGTW